MKKRLMAMFLALTVLLSITCVAAYSKEEKTADALNELGLFLGTGTGYELENKLTRVQGVTLLVRMMGKEAAAEEGMFAIPFTDVDAWAKGYVGYAYTNKITNGMSATTFGSGVELSDYMFLTLVLRALGHSDSGETPAFVWNNPYALAKEVGLIEQAVADNDFTRGDAVLVFWNAMQAKLAGTEKTLAESLIENDIFTAKEFEAAEKIQKDGRKENGGRPAQLPSIGDSDNSGDSGNSGNTGSDNSGSNNNTGSDTGSTQQPENPVTPPADDNTSDSDEMTYEKYNAMSGDEQQKFFSSFANPADFFTWYNAAKAEYEESQNRIEIGEGGSIDLGEILNGTN